MDESDNPFVKYYDLLTDETEEQLTYSDFYQTYLKPVNREIPRFIIRHPNYLGEFALPVSIVLLMLYYLLCSVLGSTASAGVESLFNWEKGAAVFLLLVGTVLFFGLINCLAARNVQHYLDLQTDGMEHIDRKDQIAFWVSVIIGCFEVVCFSMALISLLSINGTEPNCADNWQLFTLFLSAVSILTCSFHSGILWRKIEEDDATICLIVLTLAAIYVLANYRCYENSYFIIGMTIASLIVFALSMVWASTIGVSIFVANLHAGQNERSKKKKEKQKSIREHALNDLFGKIGRWLILMVVFAYLPVAVQEIAFPVAREQTTAPVVMKATSLCVEKGLTVCEDGASWAFFATRIMK